MKERGFAYVFILLIIVLLAGLGVFFYKNKKTTSTIPPLKLQHASLESSGIKDLTDNDIFEQTQNWKTYTNKELGLSIRYPQDQVIIRDEFGGNNVTFTFPKYKNTSSENSPTSLSIYYRAPVGSNPVDALRKELLVGKEDDGTSYEYVKINNAYGVHCITCSGSKYDYYLSKGTNESPVVRVEADSLSGDDISVFVEMIKTLQFN